MKSAARCLPALVVLFLAGAAGRAADSDLAARAQAILKTNCGRCHGPDSDAKGGFNYVLDRDRLVSNGKVTPGTPLESQLYQRIKKGEMPPDKQKPRPSAADIDVLRQWIVAGAPAATPAAPARPFLSDGEVLRLILEDLQTAEPRQRRFRRYLTLTHLHNAGLADADLEATRQAVAKLLNSLSWHPRVSVPQPVDPAKTILRIDLRQYQWNARSWDRLQSASPYRTGDDSQEARAISAATGCEVPVVRADWFVATAARPPLYHDLLQLPGSDRELERLVRVDVPTDLQEETVARAGFNGSGVSRNNRIIERHEAAFGAYWRSYDFSDNTQRQNIFDRPLGPSPLTSGPSAPRGEGFQHAGGEIIFNLPNGLQGYLLVDGNGRRLDRAPVEIVSDPRRPDRTVEPGLSCMSCHSRGLIFKADQVRAHVEKNAAAFSRADASAVRAIYVPEEKLRALVQEDSDRFLKALEKTGVAADAPEPVAAAALRYEDVLDLAEAAAEVGLPAEEFTKRLGDSPALTRVLGALQTRGGTVQRSAFQAVFADVLRELRPAAPARAGIMEGRSLLPAAAAPFSGHTGVVGSIAFAPDGKLAVSGGEDQTVRLWKVADGSEVQRFTGHTEEVLSVAFRPDGKQVVSGSRDRTVRVWDVESGKELLRLTGHTDRVSSVAFAPDGRHILSGGWDQTVRLWDAESGKEVQRCTGHTDRVSSVAFAPDGASALSGGHDGSVRRWDLATAREIGRYEGHTREVYAVAFSPDGRRALSGGNDRTVRLWDVATGKELRRFEGHANAVILVAFSPDGRQALSGSSQYRSSDRFLRVWDADSGKELASFGDGTDKVYGGAFSPDGRLALTGASGQALRLWQLAK
jgi:mono/diheme cytochrome c family protein